MQRMLQKKEITPVGMREVRLQQYNFSTSGAHAQTGNYDKNKGKLPAGRRAEEARTWLRDVYLSPKGARHAHSSQSRDATHNDTQRSVAHTTLEQLQACMKNRKLMQPSDDRRILKEGCRSRDAHLQLTCSTVCLKNIQKTLGVSRGSYYSEQ